MLTNKNLAVKDYEQLIEEAIAQIPLYTKEWTNFNPSDPGITILENLSAFSALQQSAINTVTEQAKWNLLALAGFYPKKGRGALTYLLNPSAQYRRFVDGQKAYAQNVCYEFTGESEISGGKIEKIYLHNDEGISNIYDLIHGTIFPTGVELFNQKVSGESALYICVKDFSTIQGEAWLYIGVKGNYPRNPMKVSDVNPFADGEWEILTDEGYQHIDVVDETCCFLQNGYVHFHVSEQMNPIPVSRDKLYRIRYVVKTARYDILPRLVSILGLLTPIRQRDTRSVLLERTYHKGLRIEHFLLQKGYVDVFVKEEDGQYHYYFSGTGINSVASGRQANWVREDDYAGSLLLPESAEGRDIIIALRDESVMPYREIGRLYGYDAQELPLPVLQTSVERTYEEHLSLLILEDTGSGQIMHVVRPESKESEEVQFILNEEKNTITIIDCGRYEGARVYLGDYATYLGQGGNVLTGTEFYLPGQTDEYLSCGLGQTGYFCDSFEDVRRRFATDIRHAATIVTAEDCIQLIKEIPGLSIHKINAASMPDGITLAVVVKPNSDEAFPQISDVYKNAMMNFLDMKRVLATRIKIYQPMYVPIHVKTCVHIKNHYEKCEDRIEECLNKALNGIDSEAAFGELISFRDIYNDISQLDCVEDIVELQIYTDRKYGTKKNGKDIELPFNALYYPGDFKIEVINVR